MTKASIKVLVRVCSQRRHSYGAPIVSTSTKCVGASLQGKMCSGPWPGRRRFDDGLLEARIGFHDSCPKLVCDPGHNEQ
jgi:hypothetical protein